MITTSKAIITQPNNSIYDILNKAAAALGSSLSKLADPNPILIKNKKQEVAYQEILMNTQVLTAVQSRRNAVLSKEWVFQQQDSDSKIYEFIYSNITHKHIKQLVSMLSMTPYKGRTHIAYEIDKENTNGWIPTNYRALSLDLFYYDTGDNLLMKPEGLEAIVIDETHQLFTCTHTPEYSIYGLPLLGAVMWDVYFIKYGREFYQKFIEKYGMPWMVGTYNVRELANQLGISSEDENEVADKVQQMLGDILNNALKDAVIVTPEGAKIEASNPGTQNNADIFIQNIKLSQENISKVIVGRNDTTDATAGSLGQSNKSTAIAIREDLIQADIDLIETTINNHIVDVIKWNFGEQEFYPAFRLYEKDNYDVYNTKADLLVKISTMGYKPTTEMIAREFPFNDTDFVEIQGSISSPEDNNPLPIGNNINAKIKQDTKTAEWFNKTAKPKMQDVLDLEQHIIESDEFVNAYKETTSQLSDIIATSKNYDELLNTLDNLLPELHSNGLESMLYRQNLAIEMFTISEEV